MGCHGYDRILVLVLVVIVTGGGTLATVTVCNGGQECVIVGSERALQWKTELCCNGR